MLYVVPTPIGNLEDISFRAVRTLKEVSLILAEDTRTSSILLKHFDIHTPLKSYHKFNEHATLTGIVSQLAAGATMALISDAGTPAISDPGYLLVHECIENDIAVQCLPGATAFVPALVNSGLPLHHFTFIGFLPQKKGRQTALRALQDEKYTFVLYESPFRLVKTLQELSRTLGETRRAAVCRELSKLHEETRRGPLADLVSYFEQNAPRGEIAIVVAGNE